MSGPVTGFERSLLRFVTLLRRLGLRISLAEVLDALEAVSLLGLLDRDTFKTALASNLVKDPEGVAVFDQAFEAFFGTPEQRQQQEQNLDQAKARQEEQLAQADEELVFQGETMDLNQEEKLLYSSLDEASKARLQDFLRRTSGGKNVDAGFKPLVESLVRGQLQYLRQRHHLNQPQVLESTGDPELDALLVDLDHVAGEHPGLLDQDLAQLNEAELRQAEVLLRRLARKLAASLSRRYRASRKVQRVDLRRSIRQNLRYGGTMLELKYRKKRLEKPRLVLLCDVSGSMSRYTGFVLQFAYGLTAVVPHIEAFLFAEDLERVSGYLRRRRSFAETMDEVVAKSQVWGEGTDLGRALRRLQQDFAWVLDGRAVLVLVSDTKTQDLEGAAAALVDLRRNLKDVIWLNTLPADQWPRHRSVAEFQGLSRMFKCNSLADLNNVLSRQLLATT